MHLHVRMHHWVRVWIEVGIVCGAVALVNIFGRNLSGAQITWILAIGVLHWLIGGIVCYALDAVKIERPTVSGAKTVPAETSGQLEWHYASEFVLPGNRKSILPPRY